MILFDDLAPSTQRYYYRKVDHLFARYIGPNGEHIEPDVTDPSQFVRWVHREYQRCKWAPATWRAYRAALRHILPRLPWWDDADCTQDAIEILDEVVTEVIPSRRPTVRMISRDDFDRLLQITQARASDDSITDARVRSNARLANIWLGASLPTGLRPIEWLTAIEDTERCLMIQNAKAMRRGQPRSNAGTRRLRLNTLPDRERDYVRSMLKMIARMHAQYELMPDPKPSWGEARTEVLACYEKTVNQVLRGIWTSLKRARIVDGPNPTLYSCRHQFASNAKSQLPPDQVSAMLGHRLLETARHYGQAGSAWSNPPLPRPSQIDIDRVVDRLPPNVRLAAPSVSDPAPDSPSP